MASINAGKPRAATDLPIDRFRPGIAGGTGRIADFSLARDNGMRYVGGFREQPMSMRKLFVLTIVLGVTGVAGIHSIADWLTRVGAVDGAVRIREEFLTGTAITVILALAILLPREGARQGDRWPLD